MSVADGAHHSRLTDVAAIVNALRALRNDAKKQAELPTATPEIVRRFSAEQAAMKR
ncbi:hypothetical protein MTX35_17925 [Rhodococcus sp. ARC_M12]|uniref:hypothetical protein n=1 Tax=Rhodococcus sp. ARC_M12 TaxID=2928854 RepID=UPI001FB47692|nr:hypothetical protein [Rhodococcus sp. ARC_M12]MCJ0979596.1 hypothetical protein [Rhodococcus sp. ARC_M12]